MDNPLLSVSSEPAFAEIEAAHIGPAVTALLAIAKAQLAGITAGKRATYEETFGAFDRATEGLDFAMAVAGHLESVLGNDALRTAYNAVQAEVSAFYSSILLNADLYRALKDYAESSPAEPDPARARYRDKTLAEFERNGASLSADKKAKLSALDVMLAELTLKFAQNVVDASSAFEHVETNLAALAGLPSSAIDAAAADAASRGLQGYRFSLNAPSYGPLMTYLDDAAVRKKLYLAFNTRATSGDYDNRELLARIIDLRKQKSDLLGFASFSDFALADRMAKNGTTASRFVRDLSARISPAFAAESAALYQFRQTLEGLGAPALQPWDVAYYAEKQRKALFDFEEETLRPYFELEHVLVGLFKLCETVFGVRVAQAPERSLWHEDVRGYALLQTDGAVIGRFWLDLFPREGKRDGAWMHGIVERIPSIPHLQESMAVVVANMTPPHNGRSLLTHREVQTLFHEFGHLLHQLLSRVDVRSLAGTRVAWDFVELPSQLLENFAWEAEGLALIAKHVDTGESLPAALLDRLCKARGFRAASHLKRQLGFSTLDLALHTDYDAARHPDLLSYVREILQPFAPAPLPAEFAMVTSFSHLFSSPIGYASGYYSYQWAEALDADAFQLFKQHGVLSPEVGSAFRREVLERGDSAEPTTLFEAFRGRPLDPDAMLIRVDLLPHAAE
jgi:oligopeptidase A